MKNMNLALSVGVLAGLWVFLAVTVGTIAGVTIYPWGVFMTWALFFAAGANNEAAVKVATTAVWGPILGWLCIYLGVTILGQWLLVPVGLGIAVFILAVSIVIMMTDIPFFSFGPGAFVGWAVFFATNNDFVGSVVILLIGVGLGWLSVNIPGWLTTKVAA